MRTGEPATRAAPEAAQAEMLDACCRPRVLREAMERALAVMGKYDSGDGKLADNHDEEYALAIEERWK